MISPDLITIFYLLVGIKIVRDMVRNKESLLDDRVTENDRRLVTLAAFFFLVPFGVLLHELGHAAATWQLGGTVKEFQWRIFWGYVVPQGNFTETGFWWIALSGNVVSVALGLIPILFVEHISKPIIRELIKSFIKIQLVYSLIAYPLFSLISVGDWVYIYDFSIRPWAQITLAVHILLIVILSRSRLFREKSW